MPTLDELLEACADKQDMLLNIEVKSPEDSLIAARYDHEMAATVLCNIISKYRVAKQTMISSFSRTMLSAI